MRPLTVWQAGGVRQKMIEHTIDAASPGSEDYDVENPTKQTELLCLELRKILYGLNGATIRQAEESDVEALETSINGLLASFEGSEADAVDALENSLPVPLPDAMPDILGDLAGLVLAGIASPMLALAVKVLLPVVGRVIARKMGVPGYSGGGGVDYSEKLDTIAKRIHDPEEVSTQGLSGVINEIKDMTELILMDATGSVFKAFAEGEEPANGTSVFCGLTALGERLSAVVRIVEELQSIMESKAVSIMHTTESDKVVFISD